MLEKGRQSLVHDGKKERDLLALPPAFAIAVVTVGTGVRTSSTQWLVAIAFGLAYDGLASHS